MAALKNMLLLSSLSMTLAACQQYIIEQQQMALPRTPKKDCSIETLHQCRPLSPVHVMAVRDTVEHYADTLVLLTTAQAQELAEDGQAAVLHIEKTEQGLHLELTTRDRRYVGDDATGIDRDLGIADNTRFIMCSLSQLRENCLSQSNQNCFEYDTKTAIPMFKAQHP